ncbi:Anthranilate phosphoribosyltransferase [Nitrospina gracilis 3/211]|uniref:Anthranilate phosphoribosyltransferase n=1 Tax=Nitrospina gracilis (strain 3/211) TaxID=1266370 RepID=M1Z1Y6_NITG3|nr:MULTISPECIES: anthranilate phosphoribosyltransferase [Nitrospina]MCF8724540.1 anthranilate phosphoribosyltransferase [Nitrospina sp. Nb-3]CCQ91709.1 Anthranilate phosphoribosyltransferase [Nitrospina gracilis 3/211]
MDAHNILHKAVDGRDLTEDEMIHVMTLVMEGKVERSFLGAFLTALRMKGETVSEITGAAKVMREKAEKLEADGEHAVDTCGTGGDGANTFNISTAVAFVVAGTGVAVAKHGNRAVSSRSGSADVLKCLGVNVEAEKSVVEKCLKDAGIAFLFAPSMHKAMKHAADVRRELGFRTIFNLLGPLTNPAGVKAQVVGVFDVKWTEPLANVLGKLGCRHAFVVHGEDGLDEITLTTSTQVAELKDGKVKAYVFKPQEVGLTLCNAKDLQGGEVEDNAELVRGILAGAPGPKRDIVLLNAAAAIVAGGKATDLKAGIDIARRSIDSGAAKQKLEDLCRISNQRPVNVP